MPTNIVHLSHIHESTGIVNSSPEDILQTHFHLICANYLFFLRFLLIQLFSFDSITQTMSQFSPDQIINIKLIRNYDFQNLIWKFPNIYIHVYIYIFFSFVPRTLTTTVFIHYTKQFSWWTEAFPQYAFLSKTYDNFITCYAQLLFYNHKYNYNCSQNESSSLLVLDRSTGILSGYKDMIEDQRAGLISSSK